MPMFCTQCGQGNSDDANYCESCGAPLTSSNVSQRAAPPPPVLPQQAYAPSTSKSRVLVVVFGVIAAIAMGGAAALFVPGSPLSGVFAKLGVGLPFGGSDRDAIQTQYNKEAAALTNKDIDGALSINTSEFTATDDKGQQRSLVQLKSRLAALTAQAETMKVSSTVEKVTVKDDTAVVIVSDEVLFVVVNPQTGKKGRLEGTSRNEDLWVKKDGVWKRQKALELSNKTRMVMDEKPLPEAGITQREKSSETAAKKDISGSIFGGLASVFSSSRSSIIGTWISENAAREEWTFQGDSTVFVKDPIMGEFKGTWTISSDGYLKADIEMLGGRHVFEGKLKDSMLEMNHLGGKISFRKK